MRHIGYSIVSMSVGTLLLILSLTYFVLPVRIKLSWYRGSISIENLKEYSYIHVLYYGLFDCTKQKSLPYCLVESSFSFLHATELR